MRFPRFSRRPLISFITPFRDDGEDRTIIWKWLSRFWHSHFRDSEFLVGRNDNWPFNKGAAVNEAARRARGRVFVILDADCYMDPKVIRTAAENIVRAEREGRKVWYVPYRALFRLNKEATDHVLRSDPEAPYCFPSPPPPQWVENPSQNPSYGHQWGALVLVMPREAFWLVGGMEWRMAGWGSDDAAMMKALDTLYALHENTDNDVLHLCHLKEGHNYLTRQWKGQKTTNANARLGQRYNVASGDSTFMRALIEERDN